MSIKNIFFSGDHWKKPFTVKHGDKEIPTTENKAEIIGNSVLIGAFTFGIGGLAYFMAKSIECKVKKSRELNQTDKNVNETAHHQVFDKPSAISEKGELRQTDQDTNETIYKIIGDPNYEGLSWKDQDSRVKAKAKDYGWKEHSSMPDEYIRNLNYMIGVLYEQTDLPREMFVLKEKTRWSLTGLGTKQRPDQLATLDKFKKNLKFHEFIDILGDPKFNAFFADQYHQRFMHFLSTVNVSKEEGVSVNKDKPNALLLKAVEARRIEIVKILLENGADPNCVDEEGRTALDLLKQERPGFRLAEDDNALKNLLLENGAKSR